MEENLGRTTIDVDVLLAPARKQLDELRSMTEKSASEAGDAGGRSLGARLVSGVGSAMASIGRIIAVGVGAGAVALGGLGVAGAKAGLETAAAMEQADIAFTTMLGSGEKADSFLRDLGAFAAKTPFEFPELQTAASSLVSAGISADKVIPIMTSLGNATSGMGTGAEGVKRATVALQQMSAAGRITGEDLNQLRDAGVPVFDLLSAATGKSVEQVAKLAQEGKLGRKELDQLMGALESGKGLERFNGLMDKQSQSLKGMWSTLKDTVNMELAKAVEPLIPLIKDGLGKATEFAAAQLPKIGAGLATIVSWGRLAYGILFQGDYKGGLVAGLEEDSPAVGKLFAIRDAALGVYNILFKGDYTGSFLGLEEDSRAVDILFKIREAALGVIEAVRTGDASELGSSLGAVRDAGGGAFSILKSLGGVLPDVATLIGAAASTVGFLAKHADKLSYVLPVVAAAVVAYKASQIAANVAAVASLPLQAAQAASNFALAAALRASGTAGTTSAAQQVAASGAVQASTARTSAASVAAGAKVIAGWVMMGTQSLLNAARMAAAWVLAMGPVGWIIAAVVALVALIIANWDTVKKWTAAAWEWVWEKIKQVAGFMLDLFMNFTLVGLIIKHWDTLKAWTAAAWDWILDKIRQAIGFMIDMFLNFTLVGLIIKHWDTIKRAFSEGVSTAVGFLKDLPGKAVGAVGDMGSVLYQKGKDLIQGLLDGAGSLLSKMGEFFLDKVPGWIKGAFKSALGIKSPSKVFAGYGENIGEGLIMGIGDQVGAVKRAGLALAAAAIATPLTLAAPSVPPAVAVDSGTLAAAARTAAAAAAAAPAGAEQGSTTKLEVHAYEGQSARSLATEVVNVGTWAGKSR